MPILNHVALTLRRSPERESAKDRYWLLTNTCYGNWLPGHRRGFVGQIWEHRLDDLVDKPRVRHNLPSQAFDESIPGLEEAAQNLMKGPPIHLDRQHAIALLRQFLETATHRKWLPQAISIMFNHFHIVVGVSGDPNPSKILGDFKSWGTRALNAKFGQPASETWWTERGSKRKLPDERAVISAVHYVLHSQPAPLVTWPAGPATVEL